jgi:MoaA/NifB/PqqE/SkfB family radical SAM enzyme
MLDIISRKIFNRQRYSPVSKQLLFAYNKHRPGGKKDLICYVPFSSLTFSWLGKVYACTYNRNILVGEYPKDSIHEIWFGERLKKLQSYLEHNDLNYGCQHCKYFVEKEKFTGLKPQSFDKYSDYKKHNYPRVMEFETSSECNLECIMCNGNTSSAIRQNRDKLPPVANPYDDAFAEQLREFIPHLKEAKFFGGEPFLIRSYFKIWELMINLNPSIHIFVITNGTVLTNKVKELLAKGRFELAVSIDSIRKERYEHIRKNADFDKVMSNLDYFNHYSKSIGQTMSLSFTSQRENWDEMPEVIEFCNKKGIVFFNSFLTAPFELSVIFLPSEELRRMHDYLSKFNLPESSELERYNKSVFDDYLKYLKYYEEKNQNGVDVSEQKDNYAQAIISERSSGKVSAKDRSELYEAIRALKKEGSAIQSEELIDKLENMFNAINNREAEERILRDISLTAVDIMAKDVSQWSDEELMSRVKKQYLAEQKP